MNQLQKSLKDYLNYTSFKRDELKNFLGVVNEFGESAIFGGMIRDFLIGSPKGFKGDIDIVVDSQSLDELFIVFQNYQILRNKFGGLRINLGSWEIDIWRLSDTWAFSNVPGISPILSNLPFTTFFELDSICYNLRSKKIVCTPTYFDHFKDKILDVTCPISSSDVYILKKGYRYIAGMSFDPTPEMKIRLIDAYERVVLSGLPLENKLHDFYIKLRSHLGEGALGSYIKDLNNFVNSRQLSLVTF